jgi:DNA-binding MarR family transcriptional regulator
MSALIPDGFLDHHQGLRLMAAFQAERLSAMTAAIALTKLALCERMDMTRLSEACGISRPGVLETVERLLVRGLVGRGPGVEDRRQVFVWLTPEGLALVKRVFEGIKTQDGQTQDARLEEVGL